MLHVTRDALWETIAKVNNHAAYHHSSSSGGGGGHGGGGHGGLHGRAAIDLSCEPRPLQHDEEEEEEHALTEHGLEGVRLV